MSNESTLFAAIEANDLEAVRSAVAGGANVNARNSENHTPLMRAAKQDSAAMIQLLLNAGADLAATFEEPDDPTIVDGEISVSTALDFCPSDHGSRNIAADSAFDCLWLCWTQRAKQAAPIPASRAREFLEAYSHCRGHAGFKSKKGEVYEGYFWVDPHEDAIYFQLAMSPALMNMSYDYIFGEDRIAFADIDLDSLCWEWHWH